jgi:hypothetical protein
LRRFSGSCTSVDRGETSPDYPVGDQAASTAEVASMATTAKENAEEVSNEIESIAAANEQQTAKLDEMDRLTESRLN